MLKNPHLTRAYIFLITFPITLGVMGVAGAAPYLPSSDHTVLEQLRNNVNDSTTREIKGLRAKLAQNPQNLEQATVLARRYIQIGRAEADPRYSGRAQSVLAPWWNQANPPESVLILRATLKQGDHQFAEALKDLALAKKSTPDDPQIWITEATVLQVLGRYAEAKQSCTPLLSLASELIGLSCLTGVSSLNGQASTAYRLLEQTLNQNPKATSLERNWAWGTLAEMAERLGKNQQAHFYFKAILTLDPNDVYAQASYADFLLDQGQPQQALEILKNNLKPDALLLRQILAEKQLNSPNLAVHQQMMQDRIEASRARGSTIHRREEAIFTLRVLNQPAQALELALDNFAVQRESLDLRILLESAWAAKTPTAAKDALEFIRSSKLEDVQVQKWVKKIGEMRK